MFFNLQKSKKKKPFKKYVYESGIWRCGVFDYKF